MWSFGRVMKVFPGVDGSVWFAVVQLKDSYYIHQVANLVVLSKMSGADDTSP